MLTYHISILWNTKVVHLIFKCFRFNKHFHCYDFQHMNRSMYFIRALKFIIESQKGTYANLNLYIGKICCYVQHIISGLIPCIAVNNELI